jgi:rod shape-determining protein MreD
MNRFSPISNKMIEGFVCLIFWFFSILLETTVFALADWFQPDLFFLVSLVFCLHWRGEETYFISLLFGLTADCFSTLPFGIYGLTFFILSFLIRWYAIKIYQEALITLPLVTGILILLLNALVLIILDTFFSVGDIASSFHKIVFNEALPTAILSIPVLKGLKFLEKRYKIHLSERTY